MAWLCIGVTIMKALTCMCLLCRWPVLLLDVSQILKSTAQVCYVGFMPIPVRLGSCRECSFCGKAWYRVGPMHKHCVMKEGGACVIKRH